MSFSKCGENPCPYHKRVLVKWEVRGVQPFTASKKHLTVGKPIGRGKIDCPALSEDGSRCQMDLGPCPADQIIKYFVLGKPVSRKY